MFKLIVAVTVENILISPFSLNLTDDYSLTVIHPPFKSDHRVTVSQASDCADRASE